VRERDGRWKEWEAKNDFNNSKANDPHYQITKNSADGTTKIVFGNGIQGRIPPQGEDQIRLISYLSEFIEERKIGASNGLPNQSFPLDRSNVESESLTIQVREIVTLPRTTTETETIPCLLKFTRTTTLKSTIVEVTVTLTALAELCNVTVREDAQGDLYFVTDSDGEESGPTNSREFTVHQLLPHASWTFKYTLAAGDQGGSIGGSISLTLASHCQPLESAAPVSTIEITTSGTEWRSRDWQQVDDFDASGPDDPHFVFDPIASIVRFGDGINGDIPPAAPEINGDIEPNILILALRTCAGEKGNVVIGTIDRFADSQLPGDLLALKLSQPISAGGGQAAETIADAQTRAREDLRTQYQAVTSADFEFLAINTPGLRVARARAIACYSAASDSAQPASVTVVVLPFSTSAKPVPSRNFLLNVCRHLDKHRLVTTRIEVVAPNYVQVSVHATVTLQTGFAIEATRQEVISALNRFLRPVPEAGDTENHGWPFGRTVFKSEIFEVIEKVPGVDCVESVTLTAAGTGAARDANGNITVTPTTVVFSGDHQVEVLATEVTCRSAK